MTQEEYDNEKAEIKKKFGKPEWDMNEPQNEAAKRLFDLKVVFNKSRQNAKKEEQKTVELTEIVKTVQEDEAIRSIKFDVPASCEPYFLRFKPEEQLIILAYLDNSYQTAAEIGKKAAVSRQKVASFLESDDFLLFKGRVLMALKDQLSLGAMVALDKSLRADNETVRLKASELVLTDSGYIKNKESEKEQKPEILDPQAALLFKELADKIALGKKVRIVEE